MLTFVEGIIGKLINAIVNLLLERQHCLVFFLNNEFESAGVRSLLRKATVGRLSTSKAFASSVNTEGMCKSAPIQE